jgi:electron transport complex protein RnfC
MSARSPIRGGLRLQGHKAGLAAAPIRVLPPPRTVLLALDQQGSGAEAEPVVQPGQFVLLGTVVARRHGTAADLHASVSGTVRSIAHCSTMRGRSRCIVVDSDGRDERAPAPGHTDWRGLTAWELVELIAAAGIAGLGGAAFPTASKLELARAAGVEWLLLNGAECEPWICCDAALMRERAADVLLGAQVMLAACGAGRCTVAIEDDKPEAIEALRSAIAAAGDERLSLHVLPAVFPVGAEGPLVTAVTGREVPLDGWPPQVGVVCQNVATAAAVARAVCRREPLVSRVVTVTGSGVRAPANVEARIGTPLADLIEACGGCAAPPALLVAGGSLTGHRLDDDAVALTKGFNCAIVATTADLPPRRKEMPCIRCGDCASACPAGLLPQQLHRHALAGDSDGLRRFGLGACIECGCCDYVCPSAIPLTASFRAARLQLDAARAERRRALEARERFERHQQRLAERAEAERSAFDEARRRAADPGQREVDS